MRIIPPDPWQVVIPSGGEKIQRARDDTGTRKNTYRETDGSAMPKQLRFRGPFYYEIAEHQKVSFY